MMPKFISTRRFSMKVLVILFSLLLVILFIIKAIFMFFQYRKTPKHEWHQLNPTFYKWIAIAFFAMGLMAVVDLTEGDGNAAGAVIKLLLSGIMFFESRRQKRRLEKEKETL